MLNDTIKLLSLEHLESLIETLDVIHIGDKIECQIELKRQAMTCQYCGCSKLHIHSYKSKKVIHSVNTRSATLLNIRYRIQQCTHCNRTMSEQFPVTDYRNRISMFTQIKILESLRNHTKTFQAVAEQYNVTAQSVINLFDNHVQPNRLPLTEYICMDEFYTGKSQKHKYALVMMDFERKQIIDIYDTRQKNTVIESLFKISLQERSRVKAVIIDMWDSYKDVINSCFPKAIVAVDSFHVIWHMNEAVKSIRIRISHRFKKEVSNLQANDMYYYMLKKFHFFLIVDYDKLASRYKIPKLNTYYTKDNLLHYLLSIDPELEAAYKLKEAYRYFNKTADYETCEERLDDLITQFKHNKSHEFKHVYKMLLNWKEEIMNSFIRVNQRRLSNGPIENINSQIKTIMKSANGYKEFYRLRNRIFYTLNRDTPIKW